MKSNFDWTGNVASVIALIISIVQIFVGANWMSRLSWGLVAIFLILFIYYRIRSKNNEKYLTAYSALQTFHYDILKEQAGFINYDLEKSISKLSDICSEISKIFTDLKGYKIAVCIKYTNSVSEDYNNLYVKTLCRDKESSKLRQEVDSKKYDDRISNNTDFLGLYKKLTNGEKWENVFFFTNFLPQKHQYTNSHLEREELTDEWYSFFARNKKWSLKYKSTVVVPITSIGNQTIYGYLCVDSMKNRGFNKDYDVGILQDIAVALSQTIKTVSEKHLIRIN